MDFLRGKVPDGEEADRLVERALFLMATGYTYTEERREEGEKGEKIVRTRKQVPPNASAIALWLSHVFFFAGLLLLSGAAFTLILLKKRETR